MPPHLQQLFRRITSYNVCYTKLLRALRGNLALNPNHAVTVVASAMGDHTGTATLYHVGNGYDPQAFSLLSDETANGEVV